LLVTALVVIGGIAIGAWFRPLSENKSQSTPPKPTYSDQQVSDAKAKVCAAFETVRTAVTLTSHADAGDDPVLRQALAANGRLALDVGSAYLLDQLQPATPQPLAGEIRSLAQTLLKLAANYLAGAKDADPPQAALLHDGDTEIAQLTELCK
jgi:hypothetical protein